ncbi:MAG: insulinase family protein, partial [Verrucomicrobia bacterium]|nr:insulinase family protein [Verrucomicrobiota bacterium]
TLCQPSFPPAELSRLRAEQITALQEEEDNPYIAAMFDLRQMLYPADHPERHHVRGTRASLKAITRSDLFTFYRRHYRPDATILALVGDFDAAKTAALIESLFGSWKAAGPRPSLQLPPIPEPATAVTGKAHRIPISDKAEAIVVMGARGVDIHAPDYFAALTANHILGGGELLNSRLLTSLREKQGLTYSVSTEFRSSRGERPWVLAMQNNPRNVEAAIAGARAELARLRAEPPTEDELHQARATLIGGMLLDMETSLGTAATLRDLELFGLGQNWVARAVEGIWKVTPADVLAAARKYLPAPDKLITVVAGPEQGN